MAKNQTALKEAPTLPEQNGRVVQKLVPVAEPAYTPAPLRSRLLIPTIRRVMITLSIPRFAKAPMPLRRRNWIPWPILWIWMMICASTCAPVSAS